MGNYKRPPPAPVDTMVLELDSHDESYMRSRGIFTAVIADAMARNLNKAAYRERSTKYFLASEPVPT